MSSRSHRSIVCPSALAVLLCAVLLVMSGAAVGPVSAQSANTTNNPSAGQTGLSGLEQAKSPNAANNATVALNFAHKLANMSSSQAQKAAKKHPKKAEALEEALQAEGVRTASILVANNPKAAAKRLLNLVKDKVGTGEDDKGGGAGGSNGDGGGGCGITNPAACIPSPSDILSGFLTFIADSLTSNVSSLVNGFNDIFFGLPAPGQALKPLTWITPKNGLWPGIYKTYYIFTGLAIAVLLPLFMRAMDTADAYRREKELKRLGFHFLMIILGATFVIPMTLHTTDALAMGLAPSGQEFLKTPGNMAKLGLGAILGFAAIVSQSSLVVAGIGVLLMIYMAIHILVGFWPLFWVSRLAPVSSVEWVGNAGIASFFGLCFVRVLQSGMLRLLFNLSWDPIAAGGASALAAVIMTIVGLFFVFIILPKAFIKKGVPASAMLSGSTQAMKKAPKRYKQSRGRIGNVSQRLDNIRGGNGSSSGGSSGNTGSRTPSGSTGSVGSSVSTSSHNHETTRLAGEVTSDRARSGADANQVKRKRRDINTQLDR